MKLISARPSGAVLLTVSLSWACGGGEPRTPTTPSSPAPRGNSPAGVPFSRNGFFDVAILVDAQAPQTPQAEVERAFDLAAAKMAEKTSEGMARSEIVYGLARGSSATSMAQNYVAANAANPPDGVLVLTNDSTAVTFGGYSTVFRPPFPFRNEYASPRPEVGSDKVYVAVLDFDHPYARCGYNDAGNRVSDVSVGGECRGRPGFPCTRKTSGRAEWMCADSVNDLYADHDYFTASTIIHEFVHPFGIDANENFDHYGTPACVQRGGVTQQQAGDLRLAQLNFGLCPDVFPRFRRPAG